MTIRSLIVRIAKLLAIWIPIALFIIQGVDYYRGILFAEYSVNYCVGGDCLDISKSFMNDFNMDYNYSGNINPRWRVNYCEHIGYNRMNLERESFLMLAQLYQERGIISFLDNGESAIVTSGLRTDSLIDVVPNIFSSKMSCYPRFLGTSGVMYLVAIAFIVNIILLIQGRRI